MSTGADLLLKGSTGPTQALRTSRMMAASLTVALACCNLGAAANASLATSPSPDVSGRQTYAGPSEVRRSRLGVSVKDLAEDIAAAAGVSKGNGVLIAHVEPGSPAAAAGVQAGDVILAVNRRPIPDLSVLQKQSALLEIGAAVELLIWRDGERRTIRTWLARPDRSQRPSVAPDV